MLILVCLLYFSVTRSRIFVLFLVPVVFANKLVNRKLVSVVATSTILAVLHKGKIYTMFPRRLYKE